MNAHTKQQQDKVFETDFIDSQKSDLQFAHLLALSHICDSEKQLQCTFTNSQHMILDGGNQMRGSSKTKNLGDLDQ